uniref:O-phosphoseryl-tRNA(Sec) selenium transferase n=1 Tax=Toxocara canis TaxID=6265 RepID=A0A183V3E4_TOXCA
LSTFSLRRKGRISPMDTHDGQDLMKYSEDHSVRATLECSNEANALERSSRCADRMLAILRCKGQIPQHGLPEAAVRRFISELACCDSNNRYDKVPIGAGEREGRIASSMVYELHMGLAHGMGRSGNLTDQQPKAIGSSMLARIANSFALDAISFTGITNVRAAIVFPVATGMSLAFCLSSWRHTKPNAKYVVFLRIDQLSCFKSIFVAGFEPIVIDCVRDVKSDTLTTDIDRLAKVVNEKHNEILAVMSTTSCFAPRGPDDLVAVGEICSRYSVKHLVNNAYGLQSAECRLRINEAGEKGHIDAFVQSLDKNFLVPVGGSIIAGFDTKAIQSIAEFYPGRASLVPSRDLLITLLQLGRVGLERIHNDQAELFEMLLQKTKELAAAIGERVLRTDTNLTSIAVSLTGLPVRQRTLFGSILFDRGITGARDCLNCRHLAAFRVVCAGVQKTIFGYTFINYGSHSSDDQPPYLNIACAIGGTLFIGLRTFC